MASIGGCGRLEPKDILTMTIQLPENLEKPILAAVHRHKRKSSHIPAS